MPMHLTSYDVYRVSSSAGHYIWGQLWRSIKRAAVTFLDGSLQKGDTTDELTASSSILECCNAANIRTTTDSAGSKCGDLGNFRPTDEPTISKLMAGSGFIALLVIIMFAG